ncbi:MAG: hypothetical protein ACUVR1_03685 [Fimbriimonadales bacterium]
MRPLCRELERHIESKVEPLPETLRAHLAECVRCQRAWQWHQAYQRALQRARQMPMPACNLPWGRIQEQLAARAVRRRPLWTRPAFGWGMAVGVVLLIGAAWYSMGGQVASSSGEMAAHQPPLEQDGATPSVAIGAPAAPTPPPARTVASLHPRLRDSVRVQRPAADPLQSDAPALRPRTARREPTAAPHPVPTMGAPTSTTAENSEQGFTVASLPLTPFGVGEAVASVEYLPIRYGASSAYHEGSDYEAVIGSF